MPLEPEDVTYWLSRYDARRLAIVSREIYELLDIDSGQRMECWLVPIKAFGPRAAPHIAVAWAKMREPLRIQILALGHGPLIPIPQERLLVGRLEDIETDAWDGERDSSGVVAGGTLEHRWGVTG